MLGNISNERLLCKRDGDLGLHGVFYCGYRIGVQNLQNVLQNELLNKNAKPVKFSRKR
jgi:hypothetical protein